MSLVRCGACDLVVPMDKFEAHLDEHRAKPNWCGLCDIMLSSMTSMRDHLRMTHVLTKCNHKRCDFETFGKMSVANIKHKSVHRKFECEECGVIFGTKRHIVRHMTIAHGHPGKHVCECGSRFPTFETMYAHYKQSRG